MTEQPATYIDQVISLLGLRREPAAGGPPAPSLPTSPDPDAPAPPAAGGPTQREKDDEKFDKRLEEFASWRGPADPLVTGRVHVINVEQVRERLGDRWPRFAERVHEVIKAELKIRLSSRDLFRRVNDDSYVIVFGDCPEAEARLKIAMISEQILEKLLGEAEAKDLQNLGVQRLIAKADGSIAAEALESTDALVAMLNEAQATGEQASTFDYNDLGAGRRALTPEEVARLTGELDRELSELEDPAEAGSPIVKIDRLQGLLKQLSSLEEAARPKVPAFTPMDAGLKKTQQHPGTEGERPVLQRIREAKERAERRIVFLYDCDPAAAERGESGLSLKVDFAYQPMWHAPSRKFGIYVCNATLRDAEGRRLRLSDVDQDRQADILAIVDRLALRKARDDLDEAAAKGVPNLIMVPVHFSTLQRHGARISFMELCSNLTEQQRRSLSWEITDSHIESWSLQLKSVIRPIAPFGRAVFLRIANLQVDFAGIRRNLPYLRAAGVHAVGVDVGTMRGSESDRLRLLERFAELAERSGLKCYGHGFGSLSMTICAVCMGYQQISGPAVAEATQRPGGIRAAEMEGIYGRALFTDAAEAE